MHITTCFDLTGSSLGNIFNNVLLVIDFSRQTDMWTRGYVSCWRMLTNNTQEMSCIPTKSYACVFTSWSLGNLYTAKTWKGKERVPGNLKWRPVSWRKNTLTEKHRSSRNVKGCLWVDNPTHTYDLSRNPKEGQDPHRAVEPMRMEMMFVMELSLIGPI